MSSRVLRQVDLHLDDRGDFLAVIELLKHFRGLFEEEVHRGEVELC